MVIRYEGDEVSTIKQGRGAPSILSEATLVSKPRTPLKSNTFTNIFHTLLGK